MVERYPISVRGAELSSHRTQRPHLSVRTHDRGQTGGRRSSAFPTTNHAISTDRLVSWAIVQDCDDHLDDATTDSASVTAGLTNDAVLATVAQRIHQLRERLVDAENLWATQIAAADETNLTSAR